MTEGLQQAAEQSSKGAGFSRGGVAAAKTQVSGSVGADVVKEIPGIIKDGFAGAQAHIPNAIKGAISPMISDVSEIAGAGAGAAKGVAGKGAAMGKGFDKGLNELGKKFSEYSGSVKKGVGATFGPMVEDVFNVGAKASRGVQKAGGAIGDSKMGQMAGQAMKQGKSMAKIAGVGTSIATLLRQSQLFTGVIGMIFQIIGAFIDILLIPIMPMIAMSMRTVAKLLPPMMKVAMFLNSMVQVYADMLEKFYDWVFTWAGKLMIAFWEGLNHLGRLIWDEGLKKAYIWAKNRAKEWLEYFKTLPASFKKSLTDAKDKIVSFFSAIPDAISGILTAYGEFLTGIGTAISGAWNTARDWVDTNIRQKIDDAIDWTGNFFSNIGTAISEGWTTAVEWFQTNIVDKITGFFTTAVTFIDNIATTIKDAVVAAWDGIKDFFTSTVPEALKTAFGFVTTKISAIFDFFATVFAPIGNFVQGVLNKISGYILDILGFMGNIDRLGIGKAVRGTMGFDDKETFNQMIKASRTELDSQKQSNQIELIIKQEGESAQYAIRAANKQANSFAMKQQQNSDLLLADGLPGLD